MRKDKRRVLGLEAVGWGVGGAEGARPPFVGTNGAKKQKYGRNLVLGHPELARLTSCGGCLENPWQAFSPT